MDSVTDKGGNGMGEVSMDSATSKGGNAMGEVSKDSVTDKGDNAMGEVSMDSATSKGGNAMTQIDEGLLRRIDRLELSKRAASLREMFFNTRPQVVSERLTLATQAWKETEGEPLDIRRAKVVARVLDGVPVVIFPGQLLVGSDTSYFRGANPHCDYDGSYLDRLMSEGCTGELTLGGPVTKGIVSEQDWQALLEGVKFWKGRTAADLVRETSKALAGSWYDDLIEAGGSQRYGCFTWNPGLPCDETVLAQGMKVFVEDAEERIRQFTQNRKRDLDKLYFWQAAVIALKAAIRFAERYASAARNLASSEHDPARQAELREIAEICGRVPEQPARTFHEALQSIVFVHLAVKLETGQAPPTSLGLVDQYLYPYLRRDLEEGRLTLEKAADLLCDLLLFSAKSDWVMEFTWRDYMQRGNLTNIGLGGPTRDGQDCSNELSYLILHVMGLVKYAEPHLTIRWHDDTPSWLVSKALETNLKVGGGVPQFQNSEHIVEYLMKCGISLEDARDWKPGGCSQAYPGDTRFYGDPSYLNVALCVDLALHNGTASATGKRLGPETGDPRNFRTFDQFYEAFKRQWEFVARQQLWLDTLADRVASERYRQPLASALLPGCLESGKDVAKGGLPNYAIWYKKDRGIVPAADSLLAIKKLVFDQKRLTMVELLEALNSNYAGERGEEIRQMCLAVPKYGNDVDEADQLVRDVAKFTGGVIASEKNVFGYPYTVNRNGQAWHYMAGKKMSALPNGRKAGEPLPDGSLSAMQGMDRGGPTALLNSAIKADFQESESGIMTLSLPASLLRSQEARSKVAAMTDTFLRHGGLYIQYNIIDRAMLLDAKKNPDKYRQLVVRVGGYSAYFVDLSPEIQDEIIRRTEHSPL